jgi:hypothetical protein
MVNKAGDLVDLSRWAAAMAARFRVQSGTSSQIRPIARRATLTMLPGAIPFLESAAWPLRVSSRHTARCPERPQRVG